MSVVTTAGDKGWMLVVDDDAVIARMFQQYFVRQGFSVEEANSPDQAIERVKARSFRAVISDLRLGHGSRGGDGLELVASLRRLLPGAAIIVLTAFADIRTIQDATALGAHRVLQKPVPLRDLLGVVNEAIAAMVPATVSVAG